MPLKKIISAAVAILLTAVVSFSFAELNSGAKEDASYEDIWSKVEKLIDEGKPRAALKYVMQGRDKALQEDNQPQLLKSVELERVLKGSFMEDPLIVGIKVFENAFELTDDKVATAILHYSLANAYSIYKSRNYYQLYKRTELLSDTISDIEQWTLRRFQKEMAKHYRLALQDMEILSKTKIEDYEPIIYNPNEDDKKYLRSIYDILATSAIQFYIDNRNQVPNPDGLNSLEDARYFKVDNSFLSVAVPSDPDDYFSRVIELYQRLFRLHKNNGDLFLKVMLDLDRLEFLKDHSERKDAGEMYRYALENLLDICSNEEVSTRVQYELALYWKSESENYDPLDGDEHKNDKLKALEYCNAAIEAFPESYGAKQCKILKEELLRKQMELRMESAFTPEQPILASLKYKNLDTVFFRIHRVSREKYTDWMRGRNDEDDYFGKLSDNEIVKTFHRVVPNDGDLNFHRLELDIPGLKKGNYILSLATDERFDRETIHIKSSNFCVSNLMLTIRDLKSGRNEGFVMNRETGNFIEDAEVRFYEYDYSYNTKTTTKKLLKTTKTDKNGVFTFTHEGDYTTYYVEVKTEDDYYIMEDGVRYYGSRRSYSSIERPRVYLFTDRSIYRPGQTVHYKGIILMGYNKDASVQTDYTTTIELQDANYQTISKQKVKTNEYGSFNGSFILPSSGLTGRFRLKTSEGSHAFRVEEYKRPRFEVSLEQPQESYRLNEDITVSGNAAAYAGSKISDARVSYEVKRTANYYPYYSRYFIPYIPTHDVTIDKGELNTDENGDFKITFKAVPGELRNGFNSVFNYQIQVDVTDINGETRSDSRVITVGEKALRLDVEMRENVDKQKEMVYQLSTMNLDGAQVDAEGTIKIERLKQPERIMLSRNWETPDRFIMEEEEFIKKFPHEQYKNELDKSKWTVDKEVFSCKFNTAQSDSLIMNCAADWEEGIYKLTMLAEDKFGQQVKKLKTFTLYDSDTDEVPENSFFWSDIDKTEAQPGETVSVFIGSALEDVEVHFSYGFNGKMMVEKVMKLSKEKKVISIPVTENMRGDFYIYLTMGWNGYLYQKEYKVVVPYSNRKLETQLITYRDKMKPGAKESWKLKLSGPDGEKIAAEMLASMYDASLDQYVDHNWAFGYMTKNYSIQGYKTGPGRNTQVAKHIVYRFNRIQPPRDIFKEHLLIIGGNSYNQVVLRSANSSDGMYKMGLIEMDSDAEVVKEQEIFGVISRKDKNRKPEARVDADKNPEVAVRKNFSETAFFYPSLSTNKKGEVLLEFTMPESVTQWNFMTFAHTKDLKYDLFRKTVQTQKDLMVMPNMPRFLRETDTIIVSAKISNISEGNLSGVAEIQLLNPENRVDISGDFKLLEQKKEFSVNAEGNTAVSWRLVVPEQYSAVIWRITAETAKHMDGEEKLLPILKNRMLVTESMPMSVRSGKTRTYRFDKLLNASSSSSLKHQSYTLEVTQNPAWYAVQALPYLADFPHECSEQIFSRYYANSLAAHIANSSPAIRQVFETWKNTDPNALMSKLEQNQELKSVILSETPWVLDAQSESEQKRRLAMLFDMNKMSGDQRQALAKLREKQLYVGGWPWFGGKYPSRYITQHIVAGFGHLGMLDVIDLKKDAEVNTMIRKATAYMDNEIREDFENLKKREGVKLDENHLSSIHVHYLYARSFFLKQFPVQAENMKAYQYYLGQSKKYWLKQNLYMQGMIALAGMRNGDRKIAVTIMESLKDKALLDQEMGMYWRKNNGYYWSQAPIERQALFIEAFEQILNDSKSVEEMKLWLLKQKQTQKWETTKSTSEAIYALLLRGDDLLTTGNSVKISVGKQLVDPDTDPGIDTEAGTGYFKKVWTDVKPEMGAVEFTNNGSNVAWGAVYWQYFEQLDKISAHQSPLSLQKELYREIKTETGRKLEIINSDSKLNVGDRIIVRIVLSTDRDMEFVHLKDMRASGMEPVNVLSKMRYQAGLSYYESTKDAATHFFFDWLPKGKYVFEYPLFVAQEGSFSNGITTVQCMYAPEFAAHTKGIRVNID